MSSKKLAITSLPGGLEQGMDIPLFPQQPKCVLDLYFLKKCLLASYQMHLGSKEGTLLEERHLRASAAACSLLCSEWLTEERLPCCYLHIVS